LSSDDTCNFSNTGDMNNTNPQLGTLKNNGGPTQTMGELSGSLTIDAGNPNGCTDGNGNPLTTDQRGAPRPGKYKHDKRCDMGAFERQTD
ncbi:MAG: choice-of-anchor Q domain-containing protein, partial [Candidatus Sulfotelmatobacter sp.]